ncbi:phosphate ABC transporter, phosphate-binding protein [Synechococcus sp. PCC 7502]|uniref:phosphate ABC transporter substrate-binding protein PstS n=1 Tax=Synechococcus sp. PCC 7502 TaxID=1173263 RepID=UPI00029FAF25|nr:phosphate ABC transporter substrate-binding protein PstS [Synechococcus sp. PCC 7502]AFY73942.1 phosphate ABC transporter, phosphate-binding protein [Synechococcus sp. PCC 7502]
MVGVYPKYMLVSRRYGIYLMFGAIGFSLNACANSQQPATDNQQQNNQPISLYGAGASFPAPLYQRWFAEYSKLHPNIRISYQSIGSAAGVNQFISQTVDFAASDLAMTPDEIAQVPKENGAVLLPMTAGSVVLAYNLPGVPELKLSRQVYVDIFLGKIKRWNDAAIANLNPNAKLPKSKIFVIYRADGSGTTGLFTKHLSAISPEWKSQVGEGAAVKFPIGSGAKGNEGVTAQVIQTPNAIAYVEYVYAKENKLTTAALENKSGKYVQATTASVTNSINGIELDENLIGFAPDPVGEDSYPIASYSWILLYAKYEKPAQAQALRNVFKWAISDGQKYSEAIGYVPLPVSVIPKVEAAIDKIS